MPVLSEDERGEWKRVCVLCVRRRHPKPTELEAGHCCPSCAARLRRNLTDLLDLAEQAAAFVRPGASAGIAATAYDSKPPVNTDAIEPHLAMIELEQGNPKTAVTITDMLISWEQLVREELNLARYDLVRAVYVGHATNGITISQAALTHAVGMLTRHLDWITTDEQFPIEDFDRDIAQARGIMSRWDHQREDLGRLVPCPTITVDGECSGWVRVQTWAALDDDLSTGREVTCRRCKVTRDPVQLLMAAGADDAYADAEALADHFGVTERTIRGWAAKGLVTKRGSRYRWGDVSEAARTRRGNAGA